MADFPATDPSFTDLVGSQTLAANNHAARHNKVHREVEAIAQRVGTTGDTDPTSHEKKITDLQSGLTASQGDITTLFSQVAANTGAITAVDTAYQAADTTINANMAALAAAVADASGINDGAIGTRKFQPTIINSNFTPAGVRYSNSAATTQLIPNCSFTYTAGPTNETLLLWWDLMAYKASDNAEAHLYVNGAAFGTSVYIDSGSPWVRNGTMAIVNVNAGSTTTLALYMQNASATVVSVTNEKDRWMPKIQGFSIYRP